MESVRHHVKEEEGDLFPKVRSQLGRNELAELGQAMADAKKVAPTRPHPRMPDSGPANVVTGALAGVVDRVGGQLTGMAQGSMTAVQDLITRFTGSDASRASSASAVERKADTTAAKAKRATSGSR
jgi:hypothetical protein